MSEKYFFGSESVISDEGCSAFALTDPASSPTFCEASYFTGTPVYFSCVFPVRPRVRSQTAKPWSVVGNHITQMCALALWFQLPSPAAAAASGSLTHPADAPRVQFCTERKDQHQTRCKYPLIVNEVKSSKPTPFF